MAIYDPHFLSRFTATDKSPKQRKRQRLERHAPRPAVDYRSLAIHLAKDHAAAVETGIETHWQVYDAPVFRGSQTASCGQTVSTKAMSATPTCKACRQA